MVKRMEVAFIDKPSPIFVVAKNTRSIFKRLLCPYYSLRYL